MERQSSPLNCGGTASQEYVAMPAYEFECPKCNHRFTVEESFQEHARHKEKCPKCGSQAVRQLISLVHVKTAKKT
jgi:putative FmdB family regulatory protein